MSYKVCYLVEKLLSSWTLSLISQNTVDATMQHIPNPSNQIQIDAIYKKFDKDNDGVLSLAEFKKMMNRENPD